MIHSSELRILGDWLELCELSDAGAHAAEWWGALAEAERSHLLWDCPMPDRPEMLRIVLRDAPLACLARRNGELAALAWISDFGGRARAGIAHFSMTRMGRPYKETLGRWFLERARQRGFQSLMCLAPWPWRFERSFIASLGFSPAARLKGACWLAARGRLCDGAVFVKNFDVG